MKRRELSAEERELWQQEVAGKQSDPALKKPKAEKQPKAAAVKKPAAPRATPPIHSLSAQDRKRFTAATIDATLDLHGLSESAAHQRLERFMDAAVRQGKRRVVVITGKGRGILQASVPAWLEAPRLRAHIAAISLAPPEKGGEGALLVLLKKPR